MNGYLHISSDGLEYIINSIESSGSVFTCFTLHDNKKLCSVSLDLSSMYDFFKSDRQSNWMRTN